MQNMNRKTRTALLSVASNATLVILKVIAGIFSGSISIISEAMHSGMDLIASLIAFVSVRKSSKPADKEHPYGHDKLENISGLAEGILIFICRWNDHHRSNQKNNGTYRLGTGVHRYRGNAFFWLGELFRFPHLAQGSQIEEESQALEADSLHLKTDVYTSLGVGIGVLLVKITGWTVLDPLVAILVAFLIVSEAWHLSKEAFNLLIDVRLSPEEEALVIKIIESHKDSFIDYHKLKTRRAGSKKHIDFHITLPEDMAVGVAHELIGILKKEMSDNFKNTRVSVHIDPYVEKHEKKVK